MKKLLILIVPLLLLSACGGTGALKETALVSCSTADCPTPIHADDYEYIEYYRPSDYSPTSKTTVVFVNVKKLAEMKWQEGLPVYQYAYKGIALTNGITKKVDSTELLTQVDFDNTYTKLDIKRERAWFMCWRSSKKVLIETTLLMPVGEDYIIELENGDAQLLSVCDRVTNYKAIN